MITLRSRNEHKGLPQNLDALIPRLSEQLQLLPPSHPQRANVLSGLAVAFRNRYGRSGSPDDIEESVRLYVEALEFYSPGHPHRTECLACLALSLRDRYERTGSRKDLEDQIQVLVEVLELRPDDSNSLHNLADALSHRYHLSGSEDDLQKMINLHTRALELRPPGHPHRSASLNNLANALGSRYDVLGSEDDLERMIGLHDQALGIHLPGHPSRSTSLSNLANALSRRYDLSASERDLERMIHLHTQALELHPSGHPDRSTSLNNLAIALSRRHRLSSSEDDLRKTIDLLTESLELRPTGHPERAMPLNNLANALSNRYHLSGSENDLERMIDLHGQALELHPHGHPSRHTTLNNLANSISSRYDRYGSADDLERTINLQGQALELRAPGHPERSESLNGLASALGRRYDRSSSEDDLGRIIELHTQALGLRPPGHPERSESLNGLANALSRRHDRSGSDDDLERMIDLHAQALELRPPGHLERSASLNNLANDLGRRYGLSGSEHDLERMIELHEQALELNPPGHPDRSASLSNLANALGSRYHRSRSEDDLGRMIGLNEQALELRPLGHPDRSASLYNLAHAFISRYDGYGASNDLEDSIRLLREVRALCPSGHPRHAIVMASLANGLWRLRESPSMIEEVFQILREGSSDIISPLNDSLACMRLWVEWARQIHHATLGDAYGHCIRFLRRYLTIGPTIKLQYDALRRQPEILSLPMDAAAYAVEQGEIAKALELLDAGRSLLWSEMRRFREPLLQPELVNEGLATRFASTCSELQTISTAESKYDGVPENSALGKTEAIFPAAMSYDFLLSRKRKLLEEYEELIGLIREEPGMDLFLRNLPFEKLQEAAKQGPVIVINCSKYGSHVIIVFADRRPSVITLDDFWQVAWRTYKLYAEARGDTRSGVFGHILSLVTRQLWTLVVSKVVKELEGAGVPKQFRIWWCPTAFLTILPFHAAGNKQFSLIDKYISSYTPTLKALIDARQLPSATVTATTTTASHPKLLVVAQTESSGLPSAESELNVMRRLGSFVECLDERDATMASVLDRLQSHEWAHFICHGTLDPSPFESSLQLYNGDMLSLNDIIRAHLPDAKFAFLAACHTAEQDSAGLMDEILHLAGAMQAAGFRSVVGTMWAMVDKDGPYVAERFYEEMLKGSSRRGNRNLGYNRGRFGSYAAHFLKYRRLFDLLRPAAAADSSLNNPCVGQRHTQAAPALWKVTREMKNKGYPLDRWINFVHIGA